MAKALDVNDDTTNKRERQTDKSADTSRPEKLEGTSLQVNENSVEEGESVHTTVPRSSDDKATEPVEGKALQVNKDSVKN